jgi:hypothetical protein
MRLNQGSLGNLLQDETSCAIYLFLLRRRSTDETERVGRSTNEMERVVEMDVDDEWW